MTPLGSAALACRSRMTGPSIDGSFSPPSVVEPLRRRRLHARPRARGLRAVEPVRIGIDLERAVEPVVLTHGGAVEGVRVDLRRVVDDVLGDRGAEHAVVLVQELTRDRMLALEHVARSRRSTQSSRRCDHGPELVVVAGDDLLAFHGRPPRLLSHRARVPICGMRYAKRSFRHLARVDRRMSESAPTAADTRRLAEEARARVRFEEEALELSAIRSIALPGGSSGPARRRRTSSSRRTSARFARGGSTRRGRTCARGCCGS